MAPIILLIGTSTAGKTSICNHKAFKKFFKGGYDYAFRDQNFLYYMFKSMISYILTKLPYDLLAKELQYTGNGEKGPSIIAINLLAKYRKQDYIIKEIFSRMEKEYVCLILVINISWKW